MERWSAVIRASLVAVVALGLVMCGPIAPAELGDAMVDMGTAMRDAASAQDVSRYAAGETHLEGFYEAREVVADRSCSSTPR